MIDVEEFKSVCIKSKPGLVVQKHIIESPSFYFSKIEKDKEFDFKRDIAAKLQVHIRDIVMVGSGKLGFSIKPDKDNPSFFPFKVFDYDFLKDNSKKKSDLDIAIISPTLFDKEFLNLYDYTSFYTDPNFKIKKQQEFTYFLLKGRFAIRCLPSDFPLTKDVLEVQEKYQREFGRVVNLEIYKSWYFFETYHEETIRNIQMNLIK